MHLTLGRGPCSGGDVTSRAGLAMMIPGAGGIGVFRHLVLLAATAVAYLWRHTLHTGDVVLWIIGGAALVNLLAMLVRPGTRAGALLGASLPVFAQGVWAALCGSTGGIDSPFVAGFGIELVFSALSGRPRLPLVATSVGIGGMWVQQAWVGTAGHEHELLISSGLLGALGVTVWLAARSWQRTRASTAREYDELRRRLQALEHELDDWKTVGQVGVHTARVTHSLKGSVQSLRGLVGLVEARLEQPERAAPALAGMRSALDHLDELVRTTLRSERSGEAPCSSARLEEVRRALEEAGDEVAAAWPCLTWSWTVESDGQGRVPLSACTLKEILLVLFRNAAEAMDGEGCIEVHARVAEPDLELSVRDHGRGLADRDLAHLFEPAFTTKPGGHGFGLYLARSLVGAAGGTLTAAGAPRGGTVFTIRLPLLIRDHHDAALLAAR